MEKRKIFDHLNVHFETNDSFARDCLQSMVRDGTIRILYVNALGKFTIWTVELDYEGYERFCEMFKRKSLGIIPTTIYV